MPLDLQSPLAEHCREKAEVPLLQEKITYFQERVGLITLQQTTSPGKLQKFQMAFTPQPKKEKKKKKVMQ